MAVTMAVLLSDHVLHQHDPGLYEENYLAR